MFSAKYDVALDDEPVAVGKAGPATMSRVPRRAFLVATAVALTAAGATDFIARRVSGELLVVGPDGVVAVPRGAVGIATIIGGVAAWAIAVRAARARRPRQAAGVLLGCGLALSCVPPVTAATTNTTAAWLLLLHLVVAAPLVGVTWHVAGRRAQPS